MVCIRRMPYSPLRDDAIVNSVVCKTRPIFAASSDDNTPGSCDEFLIADSSQLGHDSSGLDYRMKVICRAQNWKRLRQWISYLGR